MTLAATATPLQATSFNVTATHEDGTTTISAELRAESPAGAASTRAAQLHALLYMCSGQSFEAFSCAADDIQSHLLYLASSLANEVRVLSDLAEELPR